MTSDSASLPPRSLEQSLPSVQPSGEPPRNEHPTASTGLLQGVQRMEPGDWSRLVTTFGPIVYSWCRRAGVPEDDCPDLVQNVFLTVAKSVGTFRRVKAEGSFRSWLATIVRSRVCDYFRKEPFRARAAGGSDAHRDIEQIEASWESTIAPESTHTLLVRRVLEMIEGDFAPATWQAFWLTTIEGRPAVEVASITNLSVGSIYQSKSRVLRRLREEMNKLPS